MGWAFPFEQNFAPLWMIWMVILPIAITWSAVWKGFALWRAARNNSLAWFIAMLVVNTLGILEIIYIFAVSRKGKD